jgi:hypothetical protein
MVIIEEKIGGTDVYNEVSTVLFIPLNAIIGIDF